MVAIDAGEADSSTALARVRSEATRGSTGRRVAALAASNGGVAVMDERRREAPEPFCKAAARAVRSGATRGVEVRAPINHAIVIAIVIDTMPRVGGAIV